MSRFLDLYANTNIPRASVTAVRELDGVNASLPPELTKPIVGLEARLVGLGLASVAILAIRMLATSAQAGPAHSGTPFDLASASVGVITALLANLLLWEGDKINKP